MMYINPKKLYSARGEEWENRDLCSFLMIQVILLDGANCDLRDLTHLWSERNQRETDLVNRRQTTMCEISQQQTKDLFVCSATPDTLALTEPLCYTSPAIPLSHQNFKLQVKFKYRVK